MDEINLDPFERRHVGPNSAFVLRVNREHARLAAREAERRRDHDADNVKPAASGEHVVEMKRRRAA